MTRAASRWGSINIGKYAQTWLNVVASPVSEYVSSISSTATPLAFSTLPLDYYASGNSYFYGRKAWDAGSTVVNLQLGTAAPGAAVHVHDDVGNWQLWRGGRWVSRETAGYVNTLTGYNNSGTTSSGELLAHNGLAFNGIGLGASCNPSCLTGDRSGVPVVNRLESAVAYAYADVDLTASYRGKADSTQTHPERENPAVAHAEREFVFVRDLETLVIFDRLQSNAVGATTADNIKKTFVAHCEVTWTMEDAQHATCTDGTQALRLTTLVPSKPSYVVVNERGDKVGQYRLEVSDSGSAQSYFLHVLQARATKDASLSPSVVDGGSSYTVTLDATHSLVFNKGMTSAGGTITIGSNTTPFRASVQPIDYTDSGPVWGP